MDVSFSIENVTPSPIEHCPPEEDGINNGCNPDTVPDLRDHPTYQKDDFSFRSFEVLSAGSSMVSA